MLILLQFERVSTMCQAQCQAFIYIYILSLILIITLKEIFHHISSEETETQRLNYLPNAKQVISGLPGIQIQYCLFKFSPFLIYSSFLCMLGWFLFSSLYFSVFSKLYTMKFITFYAIIISVTFYFSIKDTNFLQCTLKFWIWLYIFKNHI